MIHLERLTWLCLCWLACQYNLNNSQTMLAHWERSSQHKALKPDAYSWPYFIFTTLNYALVCLWEKLYLDQCLAHGEKLFHNRKNILYCSLSDYVGLIGDKCRAILFRKESLKKMKRKSCFVGNSSLEFEAQLTAFRDLPGSLFLRCIFIRPRCSNISCRCWASIFCTLATEFLYHLRQQGRKWK